jgi:hypothetical protein
MLTFVKLLVALLLILVAFALLSQLARICFLTLSCHAGLMPKYPPLGTLLRNALPVARQHMLACVKGGSRSGRQKRRRRSYYFRALLDPKCFDPTSAADRHIRGAGQRRPHHTGTMSQLKTRNVRLAV